jgi:hypothetical protein
MTTALIVLGEIHREEEERDRANEYYEQAFNILMRRWHDESLDDCDYGWLKRVADRLQRRDKIKDVKPSNGSIENDYRFNADNLVSITNKKEVSI